MSIHMKDHESIESIRSNCPLFVQNQDWPVVPVIDSTI